MARRSKEKGLMANAARPAPAMDLRDFFSAAEARVDRWRTLNRAA